MNSSGNTRRGTDICSPAEMTALSARRIAFITFVLAGSIVGPARPAIVHASDASKAEDLIRTAVKYRREGQDQKAFPLLQRAYELTRTPRTAAQLGLVEMALGYWIESERHLAEAVAASENPWIVSNRAVSRALSRRHAKIPRNFRSTEPLSAPVSR